MLDQSVCRRAMGRTETLTASLRVLWLVGQKDSVSESREAVDLGQLKFN